jgi:hypothetical protein
MVARIPTTVHNGSTYLSSYDIISDNVVGLGSYIVASPTPLTFLHGVGGGQTIVLNADNSAFIGARVSELSLPDPADFHAHVEMWGGGFTPKGGLEKVDVAMSMVGRAVDSYSFKNDMLTLWNHNRPVQQLSLTVHDPYGITVQAAKGAWIVVSLNVNYSPGDAAPDIHHGIPLSYPSAVIGSGMPLHV